MSLQDFELNFGCPLPRDCRLKWSTPSDWDRPCLEGEEVFIQKAVLKRQREFRAGRNAARRCMADLARAYKIKGMEADVQKSVGVGESREPIWPKSMVGSITHTQFECSNSHASQQYCAAVVAPRQMMASIGIDIEPVEHLAPDSLDLIVTPNEWRRSKEHCWPRYWPKYLFAVKESFYKCMFPMTGVYLDFLEADFHMQAVASTPGVYKVSLQSVTSSDFKPPKGMKERLHGYVCGRGNLVQAVYWLDPS